MNKDFYQDFMRLMDKHEFNKAEARNLYCTLIMVHNIYLDAKVEGIYKERNERNDSNK